MSPKIARLWAKILAAVPGSRLVLAGEDPDLIAHAFEDTDVSPDRLEVGKRASIRGYLARYGEIDVALDPFPYHGTTTTCDALWMGVPVVTLAGGAHVSRVGVSLLDAVGLGELVAESEDEYVRLAVELANDVPRLAGLRRGLRERMAASPLCDGRRLARALEDVYRATWRAWCGGGATSLGQ